MSAEERADEDSTEVETDDEETIFPFWAGEPIPRKGYVPISGPQWPVNLRSESYTDKMTGTTTHKKTILYGLDSHGRAVYFDSHRKTGQFKNVVPKHHRYFDAPVDARPLTKFNPKHGGPNDKKLNAPDNDVLAVVDRSEKIDRTSYGYRFEKEIVARAVAEEWEYLAPPAVRVIQSVVQRRDHPGRTSNFPYTMAENVI